MSRRLRRLPIVLLPLVLLAALAGCGNDSSASASDAFGDVTIEGKAGTAPTVTFKDQLSVDKVDTKTLETGDGATVKDGDKVSANIYIGNGYTKKKAYSTYDQGGPQDLTVNDQLSPVFTDAIKGATIGSRIAVAAPADKAFGPSGNTQLGIGNKDTVLIIIDLMAAPKPPKTVDVPQSKMPKVVEQKGKPVALDFKGLPKPKADDDLQRSVIKKGTGATVTTDMTLKVNYLGSVYGAKAPFDESYSKQPAEFPLSNVVKGWTYGLSGVKVGSRVLLQIPPAYGYGAQGSGSIPGNATLWFVIDVLAVQ